MAEYNSDRTGSNIDAVLDKADDLTQAAVGVGGNVGIGTASPDNKLTVASGSDSTGVGDGVAFYGGSSNKQAAIESYNAGGYSGDLRFYTGNKSSASTVVTERARIDSSGNLLVGMTSSSVSNDGFAANSAGYVSIADTGFSPLLLNRKGTDGAILDLKKDGLTVGSIGVDTGSNATAMFIGSSDTGLEFGARRDNVIAPFNPAANIYRDAEITLGGTTERFKDLYLSGGVYLGGTGAANKLDDYETGTWTPSVIGASSTGTATYSARVGTYTKVGNLCYVQAYVSFSSFTGTGEMLVLGLPFAGETGGYETHCGSLIIDSVPLPSGTVNLASRAQNDEAYIRLVSTRDNTTAAAVQCDASGVIQIGVSYRTA